MKQQQIDITSSAHSPGKIIWKLAWPVMLEQILIMMVQYVDTAMVGAIGPNATAAVALTSSTNWLMNGIIGGAAAQSCMIRRATLCAKALLQYS